MTRLRNRIRKADYFSDGELLRWPRDKRTTYSGLWAIAEDSGCLEDDPFIWKMLLWPSPLDVDITTDVLATWRDELVEAGKLIPYEAEGKRYLYIRTFLQHEHPRNPQRPDLPLPEWVCMESVEGTGKDGKRWVRTQYVDTKYSVQSLNEVCTESVQAPQPRPAPSRVPKGTKGMDGKGRGKAVDKSTAKPSPPQERHAECAECGVRLKSSELADEGATWSDGTSWWHTACRPSATPPPQAPATDVPVTICGSVRRIAGAQGLTDLLEDGSDLNLAAAQFIARLDDLAGEQFGKVLPETLAAHRDRCRRAAFERIEARHKEKPVKDLAAHLRTSAARSGKLADLVGDELVAELQAPKRNRRRKGEPRKALENIKSTIPPAIQPFAGHMQGAAPAAEEAS